MRIGKKPRRGMWPWEVELVRAIETDPKTLWWDSRTQGPYRKPKEEHRGKQDVARKGR